jgi:hypothetical protein
MNAIAQYVGYLSICLFLALCLGLCLDSLRRRWQDWRRRERIADKVMTAIDKLEPCTWDFRLDGWIGKDGMLRFQRPMGVRSPQQGWIQESRFTVYGNSESDAIDALMGKETVDE